MIRIALIPRSAVDDLAGQPCHPVNLIVLEPPGKRLEGPGNVGEISAHHCEGHHRHRLHRPAGEAVPVSNRLFDRNAQLHIHLFFPVIRIMVDGKGFTGEGDPPLSGETGQFLPQKSLTVVIGDRPAQAQREAFCNGFDRDIKMYPASV